MTDVCSSGFDSDVVARALVGDLPPADDVGFRAHLASCAACGREARTQQRAKTTWKLAIDRDAAYAGVHRERRLLAGGRVKRPTVRPLFAGAIGAAVGGLLVAAWFAQHATPPDASAST